MSIRKSRGQVERSLEIQSSDTLKRPNLSFKPAKSIGWREQSGEREYLFSADEQARLDGRGLVIEAFYCEPDDLVEGPRPGRAGPSVLL